MPAVTMYGIKNCDTIKKARRWVEAHGIAYRFHDYKTDGLDKKQLAAWSKALGWEALLNRAGTTFRNLGAGDKSDLTEARAIMLMLEQPSIIKRPLVACADGTYLLGFNPDAYQRQFGANAAN